jgi:NAD(P)-dependent dehydrogenase (short-subunit alcohol dehydrogenase family)
MTLKFSGATMTRSMAIINTGPGLGLAAARRFGRQGYRLALVARNGERLDRFVAELAADGVTAVGYPADLAEPGAVEQVATAIEAAHGPLDVLYLNGQPAADRIAAPLDVDPDNLRAQLDALVYNPVTLVRRFLPPMLARGDGAILVSLGASATTPMPMLANVGIAMAGLRNYVHTLHGALAERGVYAGVLTIGALVAGSDPERMLNATRSEPPAEVLDPAELADALWRMHADRATVEERAGALALA